MVACVFASKLAYYFSYYIFVHREFCVCVCVCILCVCVLCECWVVVLQLYFSILYLDLPRPLPQNMNYTQSLGFLAAVLFTVYWHFHLQRIHSGFFP